MLYVVMLVKYCQTNWYIFLKGHITSKLQHKNTFEFDPNMAVLYVSEPRIECDTLLQYSEDLYEVNTCKKCQCCVRGLMFSK